MKKAGLNPNEDRHDYGQLLAPPKGYRLCFALGTTYSLDFDALTGVLFSLGLSEKTDCTVSEDPMFLLEAFRTAEDKVAVFCQSGQIHVPGKKNPLHISMEKMVFPIFLKRENLSFHPKIWVIKYESNNRNKEYKYRFLVMSRNLTFDRSWDVVYSMDGVHQDEPVENNSPLRDFLKFLLKKLSKDRSGKKKKNELKKLIDDLEYVFFKPEETEFEDFEFLPIGINGYRKKDKSLFEGTYHDILIMSPFLSNDTIKEFNEKKGNYIENFDYTLITRNVSLGRIHPEDVDNFNVYTLKDTIINGEGAFTDDNEQIRMQDIHAKLYMMRKNSNTSIYLGSMNATHSGMYGNVEFMIRLKTKNQYFNARKLKEMLFCGAENESDNPFKKVESLQNDTAAEDRAGNLDNVIKKINRNAIGGTVNGADDAYSIHIGLKKTKIDNYDVNIKPLLCENGKDLKSDDEEIVFKNLRIKEISEFFVVTVRCAGQNEKVRRVIKISLDGIPEERDSLIVSDIVRADNFFRYVAFLLGDDAIASSLEMNRAYSLEKNPEKQKVHLASALYEKMIETAAKNPEKLEELKYVMDKVQQEDVIPDSFRQLYETIEKAVK